MEEALDAEAVKAGLPLLEWDRPQLAAARLLELEEAVELLRLELEPRRLACLELKLLRLSHQQLLPPRSLHAGGHHASGHVEQEVLGRSHVHQAPDRHAAELGPLKLARWLAVAKLTFSFFLPFFFQLGGASGSRTRVQLELPDSSRPRAWACA